MRYRSRHSSGRASGYDFPLPSCLSARVVRNTFRSNLTIEPSVLNRPFAYPVRPPGAGRPNRMPKRADIESILIIGAGPIVIGQACEFDYSGTQTCKALKDEGYRVILVNSNPATIMTDPEFADATCCRTHHAGAGRQDHRERNPTLSCPQWAGRPV